MRKVRWGSILLAVAMLLTLLTVTAFAKETTVTATDDAAANGQALVSAVSSASEGDTIVISAGTYNLPKNIYHSSINGDLPYGLLIDKSITLKSAGDGEVILTSTVGGYNSGMVLFAKYDVDVVIDGITFRGGSWDLIGCDDPGVRNVTITNCKFDTGTSETTPIKLKLLTGTISNNVFTGTGCGYGVRINPINKREQSWGGAENVPQNLTVDITISENDFSNLSLKDKSRGLISVNTGDSGTVSILEHNFSNVDPAATGYAVQNAQGNAAEIVTARNYWGENTSDISQKVTGAVTVDTYYTDEDMTQTATVGGIPVSTAAELSAAIANAQPGDTIILAPGTYSGIVNFNGKSLTIKAQYPVYQNGELETDESKLTKFTGSFNTEIAANTFNADQKVVIEGIAFSGDGLKVGTNHYNSVGTLEVRNCTFTSGETASSNPGNLQANYFVKVSGDDGQGENSFASVTVEDNYLYDVTFSPLQLWRIGYAKVVDNVINCKTPVCAINISKMKESSTVIVDGNIINNASLGVNVSNWMLGGGTANGNSWKDDPNLAFTGTISVTNNKMTNVEKPIFIGAENENQASLSGDVTVNNNTNNGKPAIAEINGTKTNHYIVTFVVNNEQVAQKIAFDGKVVLLEKPVKSGYTFLGWKSSVDGKVYDAGETVKIEKDTTFTAQWMNNWGVIGGIIGGAGESDTFFTDVSGSAWYYDAVKFVYDYDLMNGVGNNKFNPDGTLTRAMLAQVLYNLDEARGSYASAFTDVAGSAWYANAVNWAAASGIVEGKGNNKFDPDAPVTRQEMAAILYRYASFKGYDVSKTNDLSSFNDASKVASWAKDAMSWAVGSYVLNGKGAGRLDPTGTATRAQVAQILMNFCNNVL